MKKVFITAADQPDPEIVAEQVGTTLNIWFRYDPARKKRLIDCLLSKLVGKNISDWIDEEFKRRANEQPKTGFWKRPTDNNLFTDV